MILLSRILSCIALPASSISVVASCLSDFLIRYLLETTGFGKWGDRSKSYGTEVRIDVATVAVISADVYTMISFSSFSSCKLSESNPGSSATTATILSVFAPMKSGFSFGLLFFDRFRPLLLFLRVLLLDGLS